MSKSYRPWAPRQSFLLPPSPLAWLPEEHVAYLVLDVVENGLDLSAIEAVIQSKDGRGTRPYNPTMMTALLVYGYCVGVVSSRKLEAATYSDVAFRVLAGGNQPDHTSISEFRRQHLEALASLFLQVLRLCQKAGLVKLGHVALDGTKVKANASKHKAMSYERMLKSEEGLKAEIAALLERAEQVDQTEDAEFGIGKKADDLPKELKRREDRLRTIQEAKSELEAQAAAARAQEKREQAERATEKQAQPGSDERARAEAAKRQEESRAAEEKAREKARERTEAAAARSEQARERAKTPAEKRGAHSAEHQLERAEQAENHLDAQLRGEAPEVPEHRVAFDQHGDPAPKAQSNFTDPDSMIMKSGGAFEQAYNCQAAVTAERQIIVAALVGNQAPDPEYLRPMLEQIKRNCAAAPEKLSADAGYWSDANDECCEAHGVDAYISTGRQKHEQQGPPTSGTQATQSTTAPESERKRRAREKLATDEGRAVYSRRKAIVEPVFGQIKEARGLRRFLLRGTDKVSAEWLLICASHNLLKLFAAVPMATILAK